MNNNRWARTKCLLLLAGILAGTSTTLVAQERLSLEECRALAKSHSRILQQKHRKLRKQRKHQ